MQLHGQVASILKCKQIINFVMMECSSRNTVQFLDKVDRNHECQLRKLLKTLRDNLLLDIWHIIDCTEKEIEYIYTIFILMRENCLNFLLWVMIFVVVS